MCSILLIIRVWFREGRLYLFIRPCPKVRVVLRTQLFPVGNNCSIEFIANCQVFHELLRASLSAVVIVVRNQIMYLWL